MSRESQKRVHLSHNLKKKESIVITGQFDDGTWFGGEDRIKVIKEVE